MNFLYSLFLLLISVHILADTHHRASDTMTYVMNPVTVTAPVKSSGQYREQPVTSTSIDMQTMETGRLAKPQHLSMTVPNLMYADYGSKMTSSIYVRGLGSRMDQPAMGLYVDNVPVLNKNSYDFDYFDIKSIDVLRGPQGTIYGRNTTGGVIDVHTLSPFDYQGTRLTVGYGNNSTFELKAATYHKPTDNFAFSISANHQYSDGFFVNEYNGSSADRVLSDGIRIKIQAKIAPRWRMDNTFYTNYVRQNGFAYSLYDEATARTVSVSHNDPCTYRRVGITDGLTFRYEGSRLRFSSTTGYHYLDDEMTLDQDFRPISMFTLTQQQREHALTQEFVFRPARAKRWQRISGIFAFYRHLDMRAPVTFKCDGIDELILANANRGIHSAFPDADLLIRDEQFPVHSSFTLPSGGISAYHQSTFTAGRWSFVAGIRADYEYTAISYTNDAELHYRFTLTMPEYKHFAIDMDGAERRHFFEILPRLAVQYKFKAGNLYVSAARGYKSGGFNTQIFSDIIQQKMMSGLMSELGVYFDTPAAGYDAASAISYKPEYCWNYEAGGHLRLFDGKLLLDAALFYMDCRNQQLTVFPPGQTAGRLMSNAGHTRSFGAEISAVYRLKNFSVTGSYGYTNARFVAYSSGNEDYAGKYVPYAPINTASLSCEYQFPIKARWLDNILLNIGGQGAGKIFWNEDNSIAQPFYGLLNASLTFRKNGYSLGCWAKNITGTEYNTFYFKSVGHSFVQQGKPLQIGIFFSVNL